MSDWHADIAATRERLLEQFHADPAFSVLSSSSVCGDIDVDGRSVPVDIDIPEGFPYSPPTVRPIDGTGGLSWHANPGDGTLCLWATQQSSDLPWTDAQAIVERARMWCRSEAAGWPDDSPDLDLERYWSRGDGFAVYPDLDSLVGRLARADRRRNVWRVKPGPAPEQGRQAAAFVVDVGTLAQPVHTYREICELLDVGVARRLDRHIQKGKVKLLLVRYRRAGQSAVLGLLVSNRKPVELRALSVAHDGDTTLHLRAGQDRAVLRSAKVAIVGVGAVGSVVADLLARAGVGGLTLVDADVLRPGNCIRHLVGLSQVGVPKVEAVRAELLRDRSLDCTIDAKYSRLVTRVEASALLEHHDLAVDATADGVATRLLLDAGSATGRSVISVCLLRDGQVVRLDRAPLRAGEKHAPPVADLQNPSAPVHESGCGDPVSPTPMWAVSAAASRAAGMAVDALTGRGEYPASLVDVLVGDASAGVTIGTSL